MGISSITTYITPASFPSYNDVTQCPSIRDHIGWAWYERNFFVPKSWGNQNVVVRFGSVNYHAVVVISWTKLWLLLVYLYIYVYDLFQWVNGVEVVQHSGGYLPFKADISKNVKFGQTNWITVAVNNTLTPWTIPQGKLYQDGAYLFVFPKPYFLYLYELRTCCT